MGQNAAEEYREVVRDRAAAVGAMVDLLRVVLLVIACALNVIIASRMSEACPACR